MPGLRRPARETDWKHADLVIGAPCGFRILLRLPMGRELFELRRQSVSGDGAFEVT